MRSREQRDQALTNSLILRSRAGGRKRRHCDSIRNMQWVGRVSLLYMAFVFFGVLRVSTPDARAQMPSEFPATTEQSCSFGMAKGEPSHTCQVPIPAGCLVAHAPGTTKPWTTISRGGKTLCRFDEKQTDWKTKITGTCGRCTTAQCSVQFIVRFDCNPH